MATTLLVLNGPNLNMLGTREPTVYGKETLADVEAQCRATADAHGLALEFQQTNHEGQMIDWVHQARGRIAGIVINPGAWTHTSIALHDALVAAEVPVLEVHISNVHKRESFRHHSYVSLVAVGVIAGFGTHGYTLAIDHFAKLLK
ncbi:type II 3-dehydroquinate dehydratase [Pseudomonas japonica]|uniref:type II 3-dehydroquinate dehydratase n=1 Tax=Pseudomonas japonica TaxID=256466 RepID=UPI0015E3D8AF|nr:type II 3-dehydroquinate dehydratase [Pseudomonas japonica]MBA1242380.1 type II 3-dehydroquinate dehydratase [Pseudomonas japonica]MBA1288697.1 type II 3-dehydroquinate dehydratase [Pseudomonas japonica]